MAARAYAHLKRLGYYFKVMLKRLAARHAELFEYVIVGAGYKNTRFLYPEVAHELKIAVGRAYPRCYLRELKPQLTAGVERLAVVLAVNKELGRADYSLRAAEPRQHFVNVGDLRRRIRRLRLHPVAEGRVGYPYIGGHAERHAPMVERDLRDLLVVVYLAVKIRFRNVLKRIFVRFLLKQI